MKLETLSMAAGRTLTTTLLALGATACAGDGTADDDMIDPGDTVAPQVVSTTPTASATGIGADAKIHITFSEPMDPATVAAAYASQQLPLDKVSMQWSPDQTVLTISPDQPLLYADGTGNDPSTASRLAYSISIGAEAADLAGNPLGAAHVLSFSTKVRMFTTAAFDDVLTGSTLGGSTLPDNDTLVIGDATINNLPYRGYLTFDLSALPQDISIESAEFAARQLGIEGTPYAVLGPLKVYHLSFSTMTDVSNVLAISAPGVFSEDGNAESKLIDVSAQVADDIAHRQERGNHSQYRLQFDTTSDGDNEFDRAQFSENTFEMSLVYIAN